MKSTSEKSIGRVERLISDLYHAIGGVSGSLSARSDDLHDISKEEAQEIMERCKIIEKRLDCLAAIASIQIEDCEKILESLAAEAI